MFWLGLATGVSLLFLYVALASVVGFLGVAFVFASGVCDRNPY